MNILNGAFNGQNVFFIYKGHDEIRNNSYAATGYDFSSNFDNYNNTNLNSNAINIYLFRSDNIYPGGIAKRPGIKCAVGGHNDVTDNFALSGVLAHEVGHNLDLFHTHHGTDSSDPGPYTAPENPNGSNGTTAGDLVADTPADPNINFQNTNCLNYSVTTGRTTYNPDPQNYMAYATSNCLSHFSNGQGTRSRDALENLSVLQNPQILTASINGSNTLCSSGSYTLSDLPPSSTVTWTTSSNIQIVGGQGTSTVSLQPAPAASGLGTINASISVCGTTFNSYTFQVSVSLPKIDYFLVNGNVFTNGTVCSGTNQYIESKPADVSTTYTWSIQSGNPSNATLTPYGSDAVFTPYSAECFAISVTATNSCGTVNSGLTFCAQNCFASYKVYPNPAKDYVTVEFDKVENAQALPDEIVLLSEKSTIPVHSINVQKSYGNKAFNGGPLIVKIDVRELPRGIYYLKVKNSRHKGKEMDTIRILLE